MLTSGENVFFNIRVKGYESDGGESDSSVKTVKSNKSIRSNKSVKVGSATNLPLADSIVLESPLMTTSPQVKPYSTHPTFLLSDKTESSLCFEICRGTLLQLSHFSLHHSSNLPSFGNLKLWLCLTLN